MTSIKRFNAQLLNFANVLVKRFPSNYELKLGLTGVETLMKVNPKKNVEIFTAYIYRYRDKIMNKNEDFLINTDFVNDNPDLKSKGAFDIMTQLKSNWSELNTTDKDNIWKYLQVLITLTDNYIKENVQLNT